MKGKSPDRQDLDLFRQRLENLVNPRHPVWLMRFHGKILIHLLTAIIPKMAGLQIRSG